MIILNKYEELLSLATDEGLVVKEKPLKANNGRIKNINVAISCNIDTTTEKACILSEELGHYYTTTGDILDQRILDNRRQEHRARAWGYEKLVPLYRFIDAHKARCNNKSELVEYLDVTEEFLIDALEYYKQKYGLFYRIDDTYIIRFEPLGIIEWLC